MTPYLHGYANDATTTTVPTFHTHENLESVNIQNFHTHVQDARTIVQNNIHNTTENQENANLHDLDHHHQTSKSTNAFQYLSYVTEKQDKLQYSTT